MNSAQHSTEHIAQLATYNQWMNGKLYGAAQQLDTEALHADMRAFFGSIFGTLNHLLVADTIWLKRFAQHPAGFTSLAPLQDIEAPTALNQQLFTTLADMAQRRALLDALIVDFAAELNEAHLRSPFAYKSTKGVQGVKTLHGVLTHFFNHQTHHRGQATTLFSQLGVDVGPTDLILLLPDVSI